MSKKVIITADDYGVCHTIDNAIIEAVKAKRITAVSAIVTHKNSLIRIQELKKLQKKLKEEENFDFGIGLHLCITSGTPLYTLDGKPTSLADPDDSQGRFRLARYYKFRDIERHHLRQEIRRQFEEINRVLEGDIDHLTNHHGIVYFDKNMYNEYVQEAASWNVPIRSPMSWYRKFKKFGELPDYDEHDLGNPTMRQGLKLGMWRKLAQMSYGNFLKRMNIAEELKVNYPDVLCEYIYGQCAAGIEKGDKVMEHTLNKFIEASERQTVLDAHNHTIKKSKRGKLDYLVERYKETKDKKALTFELMFHLAKANSDEKMLDFITDDTEPHGINLKYFDTREREWDMLQAFNIDDYGQRGGIDYVPYKKLS